MTDDPNSPEPSDDLPATDTGSPPDQDYKVGPGHPPLENQFRKGAPSPNPKGRPRKDATIAPDLKKALEDALNKKVKVKRGEAQVLLSKAVLGIEQLVNQFAKGDRNARRDLMDMAKELGVDLLAGQKGKIEDSIDASTLRRRHRRGWSLLLNCLMASCLILLAKYSDRHRNPRQITE